MSSPASAHIRYIPRAAIETDRWDACINNAPNGLIYGSSFYLDHMADGDWDGIVLGDYQAVMPLPWRKKFGFRYLYQPHFTPMLGVFGHQESLSRTTEFLQAIPRQFRYWDLDLNEANPLSALTGAGHQHKRITQRCNLQLSLTGDRETLRAGYKRLARRMVARAHQAGSLVTRDLPAASIIGHYEEHYKLAHRGVDHQVYQRLSACTQLAMDKGLARTYTAASAAGDILGFYLVLVDNRYVYSLIGGSTEEGKTQGAFYQVTDEAIGDHAASQRIFRFEGSDLPGIAFFNGQFGPTDNPYPHLIMNGLPFPVNRLKDLRHKFLT